MHFLIATAGALPAARVAALVSSVADQIPQVSIMTVIEVPDSFVDDLQGDQWRPFDDAADEADSARQKAVARYVEERGTRLVEPVVAAFRTHGIDAKTILEEGSDAADIIVRTAEDRSADIIVMGSTRPIFDESVWSSVSVKVMQRSPLPLMLVPGVARSLDDVERDERRRVIDEQSA